MFQSPKRSSELRFNIYNGKIHRENEFRYHTTTEAHRMVLCRMWVYRLQTENYEFLCVTFHSKNTKPHAVYYSDIVTKLYFSIKSGATVSTASNIQPYNMFILFINNSKNYAYKCVWWE